MFIATCVEGDAQLGIGNFNSFYTSINEFEEYYFIKDELARGRIEVCVGGRYGTISDTNWDNKDASVICFQLGFSPYGLCSNQSPAVRFSFVFLSLSGAIAVSSGVFGDDIESSVLYEVDCSGYETDIFGCYSSISGLHSEHSASVICQGMHLCFIALHNMCDCRCRH